MSDQDPFRFEWGMAFDIKREELLPCFLYELTREWLRDAKRRRPDVDLEKLDHPVSGWGDELFWLHYFDLPYLALVSTERKRAQKAFPSYYGKGLMDVIRESIAAKLTDAKMLRNIGHWGSLLENKDPFLVKFGFLVPLQKRKRAEGRAALVAQLRTNLRALGAYRVLQRYKWNNNSIELYHSMREWNNAQKRARLLIKY